MELAELFLFVGFVGLTVQTMLFEAVGKYGDGARMVGESGVGWPWKCSTVRWSGCGWEAVLVSKVRTKLF